MSSLLWKTIDAAVRRIIELIAIPFPNLGQKCLSVWSNAELVSYLFVGIATTAVNYIAYWFATRFIGMSVMTGTWTAWAMAVAFGYWANKRFVFKTKCNRLFELIREAVSFFVMRLASLGIETILMYLTVEVFHFQDLLMKLLINVIVIILNYTFSKLFIFKRSSC